MIFIWFLIFLFCYFYSCKKWMRKKCSQVGNLGSLRKIAFCLVKTAFYIFYFYLYSASSVLLRNGPDPGYKNDFSNLSFCKNFFLMLAFVKTNIILRFSKSLLFPQMFPARLNQEHTFTDSQEARHFFWGAWENPEILAKGYETSWSA